MLIPKSIKLRVKVNKLHYLAIYLYFTSNKWIGKSNGAYNNSKNTMNTNILATLTVLPHNNLSCRQQTSVGRTYLKLPSRSSLVWTLNFNRSMIIGKQSSCKSSFKVKLIWEWITYMQPIIKGSFWIHGKSSASAYFFRSLTVNLSRAVYKK